jgi:glutathione S-transferase
MLTLFSYPDLFGVADNNPYGLKTYAFLKLAKIPFHHEHILDASKAPRAQLPYIADGTETIGDSDAIIDHLIATRHLTIDANLTETQRTTHLLIRRTLDDLYWVMSFSRWKDDEFFPLFLEALLTQHPSLTEASLRQARDFNFQRYHYQGIGRFDREAAYARGLADLQALAHLLPRTGYMFGHNPTSIDAALYGFIANIHFYEIPTPLKVYVDSQPHLIAHCKTMHKLVLIPHPNIT